MSFLRSPSGLAEGDYQVMVDNTRDRGSLLHLSPHILPNLLLGSSLTITLTSSGMDLAMLPWPCYLGQQPWPKEGCADDGTNCRHRRICFQARGSVLAHQVEGVFLYENPGVKKADPKKQGHNPLPRQPSYAPENSLGLSVQMLFTKTVITGGCL